MAKKRGLFERHCIFRQSPRPTLYCLLKPNYRLKEVLRLLIVRKYSSKIFSLGKLLAEDSPLQLLNIYGLETLEQVFLKLCVKDDKESTSASNVDQNCQKPPMLHSWTGNFYLITVL